MHNLLEYGHQFTGGEKRSKHEKLLRTEFCYTHVVDRNAIYQEG